MLKKDLEMREMMKTMISRSEALFLGRKLWEG
jgi:hypothetical protein